MFNRPRCRDWIPLATQQLRLRNLIQITGYNITNDKKSEIYFTLHSTVMSKPFYTSDKLHHSKNIVWPEINCQMLMKSMARYVCIRVWEHEMNAATSDDPPKDKVLFTWGVYFSGLIRISRTSEVKLKCNTLVLQMHGGFFTSSDFIQPEAVSYLLRANDMVQEIAHARLLSPYENNICDNEINGLEYDKDGEAKEDLKKSNSSSRTNKIYYKGTNIPVVSTDNVASLKVRFGQLPFFKSEIRPSYKVPVLLKLQEKQRSIKILSEKCKELTDKICMQSAFCLNLDLISNKALIYRPRSNRNPSMGRTLTRLLFELEEQPKPETLLQAQELRRKIELAKFRLKLLRQERDNSRTRIREMEGKLTAVNDKNVEIESWLMENYRVLSRDRQEFEESLIALPTKRDECNSLNLNLRRRRFYLLRELKEIYTLKRNERGAFTINNLLLPEAENYTEMTSAVVLSVSMGFVAHVVLLCSIILDVPLRNPIIYHGSASRIKDNVKALPIYDREFPLFCRSTPPPDAFLYGMFLMNQNIAQLKHILGLNRNDPRATLLNLFELLSGPPIDLTDSARPSSNIKRRVDSETLHAESSYESSISIPYIFPDNGEIDRGTLATDLIVSSDSTESANIVETEKRASTDT